MVTETTNRNLHSVATLADNCREAGAKTVFVAEMLTCCDFLESHDSHLNKTMFDRWYPIGKPF